MRAVVVDRYGPPEVARVRDVDRPSPRHGQVLVRVAASAVSSGDARIRAGRFPRGFGLPGRLALGVRGPRRSILGVGFAGTVEAVGAGVTSLAVGDRVAGGTGIGMGGHAEFATIAADKLALVPEAVSLEDAAAVIFGGCTALHFLYRRAPVEAGQRVLIIGASGAVGTAAVQLAAARGAEVTGVCSDRNADLVLSLGAAATIDHTCHRLDDYGSGYDLVVDTVGHLTPALGRPLLATDGRLQLLVATLGQTLTARGQVQVGAVPDRAEDVSTLLDLVAAGTFRAVIDRQFALQDAVEAHRLVDSGRKIGAALLVP